MTFALSGLMLYTMWAIFGLMFIDFLVGFFRSLSSNSFPLNLFLGTLQDILQYVFPLLLIAVLMSLDPTGWVMLIAYYVGGLAVIWKYLSSIKNRF
ncbi:hypothetical protein BEP19_04405 [Ammoniphilus oxalaticus]|uniref:Uncharacterized protein n=1 Tax=Ammoniphilus oxalaticus TaxID=66863 RepID=A0A419SLX6_9BACL|nr:hypothetical protein [Ammoniphilus oxalaticus]RKD25069.1 hypothetical protein BEP19_04405 [Ammoniphilus oxalaticus]